MSEYVSDNFSDKQRRVVLGATGMIAVAATSLILYSRSHEEPTPVELPVGAERLSSATGQIQGTFLVPNEVIADFDCGGKERPFAADLHNDKTVIEETGNATIIACSEYQRDFLPE